MKSEKKQSNKAFLKYSEKNIHPFIKIIKSKTLWIGFGLLCGTIMLITTMELFIPHNHDYLKKRVFELKSSEEIEAKVKMIASKFVCNCGNCKRDDLNKCKCQDAIAERNMIRVLLSKNIVTAQIIKEIDKKYGGLVSSFN